MTTDTPLATEYRRLRRENLSIGASHALSWARTTLEVNALWMTSEWRYEDGRAIALLNRVEVVVYDDPEPYDWGDIEPSDYERENLQVIGVAARVAGDDDDGYWNAIWGCGFIDHHSEKFALEVALTHGLIDVALRELAERAEWAARDTITT